MEKVTDLLHVKKSQKNLAFPNIVTSGPDNRLFLDPLLIAFNNDSFSQRAHEVITDYFRTVFRLVIAEKHEELLRILENSSENNSFRLGKSHITHGVYPSGKGCSAEMLFKLLTRIENRRLIINGTIQDPFGIVLYIKDFSEDRMSDLIASIIFEQLNQFTIHQALKHNPNAVFKERTGYGWDTTIHNWVKFKYQQLQDTNGRDLSLVPKSIVTDKYRYNAYKYMMAHLMKFEQEEELKKARETDPDAVKRNKKTIREEQKNAMGQPSNKDFIIKYTLRHPSQNFIGDYKNELKSNYSGGLSDSEITSVINKPYADSLKGIA